MGPAIFVIILVWGLYILVANFDRQAMKREERKTVTARLTAASAEVDVFFDAPTEDVERLIHDFAEGKDKITARELQSYIRANLPRAVVKVVKIAHRPDVSYTPPKPEPKPTRVEQAKVQIEEELAMARLMKSTLERLVAEDPELAQTTLKGKTIEQYMKSRANDSERDLKDFIESIVAKLYYTKGHHDEKK